MVLTQLPAAYLPVVFHSATLDSYTHPSAEDMVRPWAQEAHSTTDLPTSFEDPDHDDVELPELFDLASTCCPWGGTPGGGPTGKPCSMFFGSGEAV